MLQVHQAFQRGPVLRRSFFPSFASTHRSCYYLFFFCNDNPKFPNIHYPCHPSSIAWPCKSVPPLQHNARRNSNGRLMKGPSYSIFSLVGGFVHAGVLHPSTLMRISEPRTRVITSLASFENRAPFTDAQAHM